MLCRYVLGLFSFFSAVAVFASPTQLTYQGRILKSDGTPLEYSNVSFIFQVMDPAGTCLIYQEQVTGYNMVNSGGVFDVPIGQGTIQFPLSGTFSVLDAFNNASSFTCGSCSLSGTTYSCMNGSGSYNGSGGDSRKLRVSFFDGSGWKVISPDNVIRSVPFSGYALSAEKLGANVASDFILKNSVNGNVSCGGGSFLTWDASTKSFGCSGVSGASGGTVTNVSSGNAYLSVVNGASTPVLTVNVGTVANTVAAGNDPRLVNALQTGGSAGGDLSGTFPNPSVTAFNGIPLSVASLASGQYLKFNGTNWVNSTIATSDVSGLSTTLSNVVMQSQFPASCSSSQTLTFMAPSGSYSCSAISISGSQVSGGTITANVTGNVTGNVIGASSLNVLKAGDTMTGSLTFASGKGVVLTDSSTNTIGLLAPSSVTSYTMKLPAVQGGANQMLVNDGAGNLSWVTPNAGTVTGVTGTAPITVTGTGAPVVSMAAATASVDGYLKATDFVVFNSKLSTSTSFSGDVSGNYSTMSVDKIKGKAVVPVSYSAAQVLRYDGTNWVNASLSSADLSNDGNLLKASSMPSNCSTNQTLTFSSPTGTWLCSNIAITGTAFGSQSQAVFLAGPVSGSGTPIFRGIAASDLPAGTLSGTGSAGALASYTSANTLAASPLYSDGTNLGLGTATPKVSLDLSARTDALALPSGTTAQQPATPMAGWIRYNSTTNVVEYYNGTTWSQVVGGGVAVDPAGLIGAFPTATCPSGWLEANGAAVSRTTYASLFAQVGVLYGAGDGTTTFNLPDYRGYFLRGWSHGSGNDTGAAARTARADGTAGDNVGTVQQDQFQGHRHQQTSDTLILTTGGSGRAADGSGNLPTGNYTLGPTSDGTNGTPRVGPETRPKNINVIYCISTATNSATTVASSGSGTANFIPQWTSSTALGNSPLSVNGTNVGVGTGAANSTLDVNGEVRVGNSGVICGVANEGATRYNSTSKKLEFCDATSWRPVNSATRRTVCSYSNSSYSTQVNGQNIYNWTTGDCDNGFPSTGCVGYLSKAVACGSDSDWAALGPNEIPFTGGTAAGANGGISWSMSTPCNGVWVRVVYECSN